MPIEPSEAERFYMRFGRHGEFALATYGLTIPRPVEALLVKRENERALKVYLHGNSFERDQEAAMQALAEHDDTRVLAFPPEAQHYSGTLFQQVLPVCGKDTHQVIYHTRLTLPAELSPVLDAAKKLSPSHRKGFIIAATRIGITNALAAYRDSNEKERRHLAGAALLPVELKRIFRQQSIHPKHWFNLRLAHEHATGENKHFFEQNAGEINELLPDSHAIHVNLALTLLRTHGIAKVKKLLEKVPRKNRQHVLAFLTHNPSEIDNAKVTTLVRQRSVSFSDSVEVNTALRLAQEHGWRRIRKMAKTAGKYDKGLGYVESHVEEEALEKALRARDIHLGEEYTPVIETRVAQLVRFPVELRVVHDTRRREEYYNIAHAQDGRNVGWIRVKQADGYLFVDNIQSSDHRLPTRLRKQTDNWAEEAVKIAEERAKQLGLHKVVIKSPNQVVEDSLAGIQENTLKNFYYDLPKKMGYNLEYLPDKSGFHWVKELH